MTPSFPLPIDDALPALTQALAGAGRRAVLMAPPGAGKTTRVPLALLDEPWAAGARILLLEPRRIAARAAASRMAATLGEKVGDTVGLRVRLGSRIGPRTRIEVVTEGVFTRMILDDPELSGVAAVLFDEFHERSLDADLGLALTLDAAAAFREDLRVLVMSATLDGTAVARILGEAALVESAGRAFPVETRHAPRDPRAPLEAEAAAAVRRALAEEPGSALVFLPGQAEIRRTGQRLRESLRDATVDVVELHGGLDAAEQDRAIRPAAPGRRKVVLATSIAETSLTIEGVRIVVDCGLARVPVFEPDVGVTRLETVRVSRAAADQRRGRAGRTEPGVCYRLWEEAQTMSLEAAARPEILSSDLAASLLDLAAWGTTDPSTLKLLDPPPAPALAEARALLVELEALDADGRLTGRGARLRRLPLPPRLAAMVIDAAVEGEGRLAAEVAALLVERGLGGEEVDLAHRLESFRRERSPRAEDARRLVARWAEMAGAGEPPGADPSRVGALLARAYPDRIAKPRGRGGDVLLANGRGAAVEPTSHLARAPLLVVAELTGTAARGRVLAAAELSEADLVAIHGDRITEGLEIAYDGEAAAVRARQLRRYRALVLAAAQRPVPADPSTAAALARGLAARGIDRLPWSKEALRLRHRVGFVRAAEGDPWPDLSDAALAAAPEAWLAPFLVGRSSLAEVTPADLSNALAALLPHDLARRLDREAPTHFAAPSGSSVPIDYEGEAPTLAVRVQELFGLDRHPAIAGGKVPLVVELLSPAHRPVQVTRDLPAFWRGSYAAVRSEMRGRYPKHPWPDDPLSAPATHRAKPRGT